MASYMYGGKYILRQIRGGSTLKYVHGTGVDETLATDDGAALSYFNADGLGSIVAVTNGSGAVNAVRQCGRAGLRLYREGMGPRDRVPLLQSSILRGTRRRGRRYGHPLLGSRRP
jgi:hypothetical protein